MPDDPSPSHRQRSVIAAALLTLVPAIALYPALNFFITHFAGRAILLGFLFMLACAAAEASGLILAGRTMSGTFDALEVAAISCLVVGVLTLGFVAWALATNFHPG